jgi:phosphoadenosine phosphosulfate reductase
MIQQTFSGDLVSEAITLLKSHEPGNGYWLAFSGGKDSIVIHDLAKRAGVKFVGHFSKTTVDPPEVTTFIRENYPDVVWAIPKKSMFEIIVQHGTPPTRFRRYCCRDLKEIGGRGETVILGIRAAESARRRKRKPYEESRIHKGTFFVNPILSWKDADVWDYIRGNGLAYPPLYDQGRTRIGCILCPLQSHRGRVRDLVDFPKFAKAYLRAFGRMLNKMKADGKESPLGWKTPEDVMDWWINGDTKPAKCKDRSRGKAQEIYHKNKDLSIELSEIDEDDGRG